ncbi:MAG: FAD binding domain-containing protein [Candidatus Poribacteria bacterium]|nr:FAD binding domain-containing protein [Candidatus Poribacteria bacterium]
MIDCHYVEPTTVDEACRLLAEHGDGGMVVAGGQVLSLLRYHGLIEPSCLVSLQHVAGLDGITAEEEGVKIGAMVTLHRLESVGQEHPTLWALSEAVKNIADRQIRNHGTLSGNICAAHQASDINTVLMALNASVKLVNPNGERIVNLHDFVTDAFTTTAEPGELLTEVIVPHFATPRSAAAYHRFALRAGDYPVVSVGTFVSLDEAGLCLEGRIVLGNCLGAPTHAAEAEQRLQGCNVVQDDQSLAEAANLAAANVTPWDEPMASGEYKKDLVSVLTREALTEAVASAVAVK